MDALYDGKQTRLSETQTINTDNISVEELMTRAGKAIADEVSRVADEKKVNEILVVCGFGNNGGDGYVCARELQSRGYYVTIYAVDGKASKDCEREKNLTKCHYFEHTSGAIDFSKAKIIVDCIFGVGLSHTVQGEARACIEAINSSGSFVVSADIPSGLNCDNGFAEGVAVKANLTVSLGFKKLGEYLFDGLDYCGEIITRDIGLVRCETKRSLSDNSRVASVLPKRVRNSHKGTYGTATIVAGSKLYLGAALLSAEGALRSGCGYVKLRTADEVKTRILPKFPQIIFQDDIDLNSQAVAFGMGLGVSRETHESLLFLLSNYGGKLLIDADGLNSLAKFGLEPLKRKTCDVVLTPHVKEFARLTGLEVDEILRRGVELAESFANEYGVTMLLKGASSIVTDGNETIINIRGTTALAKGGSGDILSGLAAGLMSQGLSPFDGVLAASYLSGLSAEICSAQTTDYCVTAREILKNLHLGFKSLLCGTR